LTDAGNAVRDVDGGKAWAIIECFITYAYKAVGDGN
jgi:hypothetical protein